MTYLYGMCVSLRHSTSSVPASPVAKGPKRAVGSAPAVTNIAAMFAIVGVVTDTKRNATSDLTRTYVGPRLVRSPKFAMTSPSNGDRVAARVFGTFWRR